MGIGKDLLGSLTGRAETAYLVVDDLRDSCKPVTTAPAGGGALGGLAKAASAVGQAASKAASAAGAIQQTAAKALTGGASAAAGPPAGKKPKYFKVQFNPSELQLDAALAQETRLDAQVGEKGGKRTVADANQKPTVTLSVALIFDDTNLSDAFMGEKFATGLGGTAAMVTNAASAVATVMGKKWSVQPQVEALLAALRNNYTRYVTFYWSNFSFAGQLISVSAQYTMFSSSGRPIRATVYLRIRQELDPANVNTWYRDFADSFGWEGSLTGAAQKVGNLLNLKL